MHFVIVVYHCYVNVCTSCVRCKQFACHDEVLCVLFQFDMFKNAKDGVVPPKPSMRPEEVPEVKQEEKTKPAEQVKEQKRKEPVKLLTRDGRLKAKERSPPIREWDRDKIRQSRSRSRDRNRREEKAADRGARAGRGDAHEKDQNRDKSREERRKRRASSPEHKEKKGKSVNI